MKTETLENFLLYGISLLEITSGVIVAKPRGAVMVNVVSMMKCRQASTKENRVTR